MRRFTVPLDDADSEVDLQDIAVSVADGTIAFEARGVIRGVDADALEAVAGSPCRPTAVMFECNEGKITED